MDYGKFQNCLRLQITQDDMASKRIDDLVFHCKKYGFTNVMLMINAEEFNLGHISIERAKPWVEILKIAKKKLIDAGISVSLNNWIEIGHLDRMRSLLPSQNFRTMVDMNGKAMKLVACPLDYSWKNYFLDYTEYLVRELSPDTFWIEDDLRYHNHGDLEWGGCFCEEHVRQINKLVGGNYDRQRLVEKIFQKGNPTKERIAWLDFSRKSILDLANDIATKVREVSPKTDVALMSSTPEMHAMEGRDWKKLLEVLAGENNKINRIHLPCYFESAGKDYYFQFNSVSMAVRSFNSDDTIIMPETENGSSNLYRKSAKFLQFQVESAIPLVINGMTYSIYDFVGNGVVEEFGYAEKIKSITPYLQGVMDLNIKFSQLTGVIIPIGEDIDYKLPIYDSYKDLITTEFNAGGYFALQGISYRYSTERVFKNQVVALFGQATYLFSDKQIVELFENNKVILDGGAVLNLTERGLNAVIGVINAKEIIAEKDIYSYEECCDGEKIYGIDKFRASCRVNAGNYVKIEYKDNVKEHSKIYDYNSNFFGKGIVSTDKILITPYVINKKIYGQFSELRRQLLIDFIENNINRSVITKCCGISPYLYRRENDYVLILVNSNVDDFEEISLSISSIVPEEIKVLEKDGNVKLLNYTFENKKLLIKRALLALSTTTLIIDAKE